MGSPGDSRNKKNSAVRITKKMIPTSTSFNRIYPGFAM
jgi:hypothetical protein